MPTPTSPAPAVRALEGAPVRGNDLDALSAQLASLSMRLDVCFHPSKSTGDEVQAIAERLGVKLIGGSSDRGMLCYEAVGAAIGQFRDAMTALGLNASFGK